MVALPAHAGEESPHSLRVVMQHLQAANAELQEGLMTGNRLMISRGAARIADHPNPKGGLAPYIKKNHQKLMTTIKSMDQQVHHTAKEISEKAKDAPMMELHQMASKMTAGCVGCHGVFRD